MADFEVGDKVKLWYYGIQHEGKITQVKGSRARVRFVNESGATKEHWRLFRNITLVTVTC